MLLVQDWAGRDTAGAADPQQHGYERIGLFRKGVVGGAQACLRVDRAFAGRAGADAPGSDRPSEQRAGQRAAGRA